MREGRMCRVILPFSLAVLFCADELLLIFTMDDLSKRFPKFWKIFDDKSKLKRKIIFLLKVYFALSILSSAACHLFIMSNYTFKLNGGAVSINFFIHYLMQILLIFRSDQQISIDEISCLLNKEAQRKLERCRATFKWLAVVFVTLIFMSSAIFLCTNGPSEVLIMAFGYDGNELDGSFRKILLVLGINNLINMLITFSTFSVWYSFILHAISLFAIQNVTFVDTLVAKCDVVHLTQETFCQIEELYLIYRELVEKVNFTYGRIPLWCLMMLYANITSFGALFVIFKGNAAICAILARTVFFSISVLAILFFWIHMSNLSYRSMETFRRKGITLVNLQLKRSKCRDASYDCLVSSLRGISVVKIKAGQMYNMESSIVISLIASAIPMTVMFVQLMREL